MGAKIHAIWDEGCGKDEDSLGKTFRRALLEKCREEFDTNRNDEVRKIREDASLSKEDKEEKEIVAKKRYTGHMRFIGELYQKDMVNHKTMHNCLAELIQETDEETLVCMCKLMNTIGHKLEAYDRRKGYDNFAQYFEVVDRLSKEHNSSRMRFMMKDLIDARTSGWVQRREEEKAVHLNELRAPPGGAKGSNKLSFGAGDARTRTGANKSGDARNLSADEWQTVPSSSRKGNRVGAPSGPQHAASGKSRGSNFFSGSTSGGQANKGGPSKGFGGARSSSEGKGKDSSKAKVGSGDTKAAERDEEDGDRPDSPSSSGAELSRQASELSVSSVVYDSELPGYDGTLSKEVLMKVRSIVEEYYMNEDPAEALLSLREVMHPYGMGYAIGASKGCIELVFEKFPNNMTKLCDLLVSLWAEGSEEAFLTSDQATKAFYQFLENYDDMSIDVPKAGEYGAEIMAHLIDSGVISLSLFDSLPEDNLFNECFKKAAFLGGLLVRLASRPGQTQQSVCNLYRGCKIDVLREAAAARGPKQSEEEAREEFLAKYPLQFLI